MQTQKTIVSAVLGIFFLILLLVGGRYIMQLNTTIHALQDQVEEVSTNFSVLLGKYEAEQNAHGAAEIEMEDLDRRIQALEKLTSQQDAILLDIGLQLQ